MTSPVYDVLEPRLMRIGPDAEPEFAMEHWRLTRDEGGIGWLAIDRVDASANTLGSGVLEELNAMLDRLEQAPPRGLILHSAKKSGFLMGADIREFRGWRDPDDLRQRIERGHALFDRLEALPFPTVALIHGFCLGGGLELALACDHRVAIGDARLGFPEVLLGLHPGLGGTFRSTALIDPVEAMTMMLTGRTVHAKKAKRLGLVDAAVEPRHAEAAARAAVHGKLTAEGGGLRAAAFGTTPGRRLAARQMRSKTRAKARPEHYPAPYALIDLWEEHGGDRKAMQKAEIDSFAKLGVGDTAQNLVRVFFLREALKEQAKGDAHVHHVHVIGAGAMGGEIAAWCAMRGLRVTLADLDHKMLAQAIGRARKLYDDRLHDRAERREAMDRLIPDFTGDGLRHADLVIEAIAEKLDAKRGLYDTILPKMKDGALLATNTSSIPLEKLSEGLPDPARLVGLHFFNPVSRMELVEVVRHARASDDALARARAFCGRIGRLPVPVESAPGFLVNRVLTPYLLEALVLIDQGMSAAAVDDAAERFGMAMGPVEVADRVGLDICLHVAEHLQGSLARPLPEVPDWLRQKIDRGELGRKTGKGLYDWKDGKPQRGEKPEQSDPEVIDRLILPMVNTAAECLRQGIVGSPELTDGAMIFGAGFAPFRGGPAHYARTRGADQIAEALRKLAERHGPRFEPDEGLDALARG